MGPEDTRVMTRPAVRLPAHRLGIDEVVDRIAAEHAARPALTEAALQAGLAMVRNTQVASRAWLDPPEQVLDSSAPRRDLMRTARALADLAVEAAAAAISDAAVEPERIGTLIVTSSTGYLMPGADVQIVNRLGLSPRVRRIPAAQLGCAGAAWALARGLEQARLDPQSAVLVVGAEAFSLAVRPDIWRRDAMVWRGLAGDGAAASVLLPPRPDLGGLHIYGDPFEYLLRDSAAYYYEELSYDGFDFHTSGAATRAVAQVMGDVRAWLGDWPTDMVLAHTGGPRILLATAQGLGLPDEKPLRWSWASLRAAGNLASAGVPHAITGLYSDPPPPGTRGVIISYGPGFTVAAVRCAWT